MTPKLSHNFLQKHGFHHVLTPFGQFVLNTDLDQHVCLIIRFGYSQLFQEVMPSPETLLKIKSSSLKPNLKLYGLLYLWLTKWFAIPKSKEKIKAFSRDPEYLSCCGTEVGLMLTCLHIM